VTAFTIAASQWVGSAAHAEPTGRLDRSPYGWLLAVDTDVLGVHIDRAHVGGWADAALRTSDLDEEGTNVSVNHLNAFADVRFEDHWQLFVEAELEYRPALATLSRENDLEVEQAYLKYSFSDRLEVRVGRFSTPFGFWTPVHWTIRTDTVAPPLFESRRFVPEQQVGARVSGRIFPRALQPLDVEVNYSVWGGYASDEVDVDGARGATMGADLRIGAMDRGFLGASFHRQDTEGTADPRDRENDAVVYGELSLPAHFTLRGEYLYQRTHRRSAPDSQIHSVYGKVRWDHGDWSLNYRFERSDDPDLGPDALQRIDRFTIGYSLLHRVRLKAEYARHRTLRASVPDFDTFALWLGVFF